MIALDPHLWALVAALLLDAAVGDPAALWRAVPHPVVLFGRLIGWLDRRLNLESLSPGLRRRNGAVALFVLLAVAAVAGVLIDRLAHALPYGEFLVVIAAAILIAQRGLYDAVDAVARPLATGDIDAARAAVGQVVGRDTAVLERDGIARAAIETLAENFGDAVMAPAFWFALLGLPGLLAYKALNTADSMIGHRSPRHEDFGRAAAKLDDLANFIPARFGAMLLALVAPLAQGSTERAFTVIRDDAPKHRSPNAGWLEAAMAGGIGVALAGPRRYGERLVDDPFLNPDGKRDPGADHIRRAQKVYVGACAANLAFYAVLAVAFFR